MKNRSVHVYAIITIDPINPNCTSLQIRVGRALELNRSETLHFAHDENELV
jgi:hypothetical protein